MLISGVTKILSVSFILHGGCSFLIDSSTLRPSGGGQYLTTRHYMQLMDLLFEEKQSRRRLEQIVTTLQTKVDAMSKNEGQHAVNITTYLQPYVTRIANQEKELTTLRHTYDSILQTKESEIDKLHAAVTVLEHNHTSLLRDYTVTQANYRTLRLELEGLKQIKNLNVAYGLQQTNNDINKLKASNQARSQDFLALYNLTISFKKDISIAKKELDNVYNVGFTVCEGYMVSAGRIKFTSVKSSNGISMASSYRDGKFIAPKAGFYLVLSNILSNSQTGFYIRKNGKEIARAWSLYKDSNIDSFYSAPLSAFLELSVNDVITIEGESLNPASCLSIVQL